MMRKGAHTTCNTQHSTRNALGACAVLLFVMVVFATALGVWQETAFAETAPNSGATAVESTADESSAGDNTAKGSSADGSSEDSKAETDELSDDNLINPQQLPDSSFIYSTSIDDLAGADAYFDGQTVQVVGETIGDKINADMTGQFCWITLASEDTLNNTISIYMSHEAAKSIDLYGRYGSTGTILQVQGTYHLACSEHEGISDIHAEHVNVVEKGKVAKASFDINAFIPGAIVVAIGVVMIIVYGALKERQR